MRTIRLVGLLLFSLLLIAGTASATGNREYRAVLSSSNEVPPNDTPAHGVAQYHVNSDGTAIRYTLNVTQITNVVAGHIHVAAPGVNGPVVVPLYTASACRTLPSGIRCNGTITAADLVGPLAGHPLSDLIALMDQGQTYTNVHTTEHPGGVTRGQIGHGGPTPDDQ
jgi:hypothetical protein